MKSPAGSSPTRSAGYGTADALAAARSIAARAGEGRPSVGIILGSGLGALVDEIEHATRIPYAEVPGFPSATVPGHAGAMVLGRLKGVTVAALAGRFHMYEGHSARLAAFPTRVLHALGARTLIVTNAAGGVRRTFEPGTLMLIRDHINLMFRNPLSGAVEAGDVRFPDMSAPYDRELLATARQAAARLGIAVDEGVYAASLGPTYETPAESRMLERLGVDATGMSTVPEVIVARAIGMRVLGISCITNAVAGLSPHPITHEEVIETTNRVGRDLVRLVSGVVETLGDA